MHVVDSGQLQILSIGSNIRDPGQLCTLGAPCAHLKYFLQSSLFGINSPSWLHLIADPRSKTTIRSGMIFLYPIFMDAACVCVCCTGSKTSSDQNSVSLA